MPLPNGDNPPTDTTLFDLASKAYDDAEAAMGDTSPPIAAPDAAGESNDGAVAPEPKAAKDSAPKLAKSKDDRGDGRRPDGTFAKKTKAEEAAEAAGDGEETEDDSTEPKEVVPADANAKSNTDISPAPDVVTEVRGAPPPGWAIKSKAEWDKLPAHVRADIIKREQEVDQGFKMYEGVRPYAERARQQGQTLDKALHAYTAIEDLFRRDAPAGFLHLAQNAGMTQHQAGQVFLQLAANLGAVPPSQQNFGAANQTAQPQLAPGDQNAPGGSVSPQGGAADPQASHQQLMGALEQMLPRAMGPLAQRLQQLETERAQQAEAQQSQRLTASGKVIGAFRQDPANRYYADVENAVGDILASPAFARTGDLAADLKSAYDTAVWQHPEIREHLISERTAKAEADRKAKDREAAAKAKAAGKSVTGAPSAGAKVSSVKGNQRQSDNDRLRALAEQAYQDASGRV